MGRKDGQKNCGYTIDSGLVKRALTGILMWNNFHSEGNRIQLQTFALRSCCVSLPNLIDKKR